MRFIGSKIEESLKTFLNLLTRHTQCTVLVLLSEDYVIKNKEKLNLLTTAQCAQFKGCCCLGSIEDSDFILFLSSSVNILQQQGCKFRICNRVGGGCLQILQGCVCKLHSDCSHHCTSAAAAEGNAV